MIKENDTANDLLHVPRKGGRDYQCVTDPFYKQSGTLCPASGCDYDIEICFTGFTLASSRFGTVT